MPSKMTNEMLTIQEAADILKVSTKTILGRIRDCSLKAHLIGNRWRIHRESLRSFLAARENLYSNVP